MISFRTLRLSSMAALLWTPLLAWGEPATYEGFDSYANVNELVSSQQGGVGFASRWQSRASLLGSGGGFSLASLQLLSTSLEYLDPDGIRLGTSGGALHLSGEYGNVQIARSFDQQALPNIGPDPQLGKTTYLSFLARREGPPADPEDPVYAGSYPWGQNLYPRVAGVNLFTNDPGGDPVDLLIGNPSNESDDIWRIRGEDLDGDSKDPRIEQPFGQGNHTYLVVLRIDHGEGDNMADQINMYLNPRLADESLNSVGAMADWEQRDDPMYLPGLAIGLEVGNASGNRPHAEFTFDEFRIGQTWRDVLPIAMLPGDYNGDGLVDLSDYVVWRDSLGSPSGTLPNDPLSDVVGLPQYETWKTNFAEGATSTAAFASAKVPEPRLLHFVGLALLLLPIRRWRL